MNILHELVERGIIDQKNSAGIEVEMKESGRTAEEIILDRNIISEDVIFKVKSETIGVTLKRVPSAEVALEVLEIIPEETTATYKMVPLARKNDVVEIGMVYPESMSAQDALRFLSRQGKFRYEVYLITLTDFDKLLKQHRTLGGETEKALAEIEKTRKENMSLLKKNPKQR